MNYSINHINDLPDTDVLKACAKGLALIDSIVMPEWEYRYFSFDSCWVDGGIEMMASMRDGSGAEYFINFTSQGVVGKVFSGDPLIDVEAALAKIPESFSGFKKEPAFSVQNSSYFFWRCANETEWSVTPNDICNLDLLKFLVEGPKFYHKWAEHYYEKSINAEVLKDVFDNLKISGDQLLILNPDIEYDEIQEDLKEILGGGNKQ